MQFRGQLFLELASITRRYYKSGWHWDHATPLQPNEDDYINRSEMGAIPVIRAATATTEGGGGGGSGSGGGTSAQIDTSNDGIPLDGVEYKKQTWDSFRFTTNLIKLFFEGEELTISGYRWTDKYGNYRYFDEKGKETEYGNRNGVIGKMLYEPDAEGKNGKLIGFADKNDRQG